MVVSWWIVHFLCSVGRDGHSTTSWESSSHNHIFTCNHVQPENSKSKMLGNLALNVQRLLLFANLPAVLNQVTVRKMLIFHR